MVYIKNRIFELKEIERDVFQWHFYEGELSLLSI